MIHHSNEPLFDPRGSSKHFQTSLGVFPFSRPSKPSHKTTLRRLSMTMWQKPTWKIQCWTNAQQSCGMSKKKKRSTAALHIYSCLTSDRQIGNLDELQRRNLFWTCDFHSEIFAFRLHTARVDTLFGCRFLAVSVRFPFAPISLSWSPERRCWLPSGWCIYYAVHYAKNIYYM